MFYNKALSDEGVLSGYQVAQFEMDGTIITNEIEVESLSFGDLIFYDYYKIEDYPDSKNPDHVVMYIGYEIVNGEKVHLVIEESGGGGGVVVNVLNTNELVVRGYNPVITDD